MLLSVCLGQTAQGGPHTSQRGPHSSQGGAHENQGRLRREVLQNENGNMDQALLQQNPKNWTTCDVTISTKISCQDCSTRLICKPIGGLLVSCNNPKRPYCNNGICSAIPSVGCV